MDVGLGIDVCHRAPGLPFSLPSGFFIVALAVPVLDLVGGVSACAAAGDFLDEGSGVGGQLSSIVQDAELVVIDRHDDDLAAVGVPDLELGPGDHEQALAGDHPGDRT
jgi:hypothetical protein